MTDRVMLVSASLAANSAGCFLPARAKALGTSGGRATVEVLWEIAKAETTLENAERAAKRTNASPSRRRKKRQLGNSKLLEPDTIAKEAETRKL